MATALDKPNEVELHVRAALRRGATRKEVVETIVQVAPYAGFPMMNHGLLPAQQAFDAADRDGQPKTSLRPSRRRPAPA